MKNLLLGTFFTAALILAGTTNTNAQKKAVTPAKRAVSTKQVVAKKVVAGEKVTAKKVTGESNAKTVPGVLKPIGNKKAATPASRKTLKKVTAAPVKATPVKATPAATKGNRKN